MSPVYFDAPRLDLQPGRNAAEGRTVVKKNMDALRRRDRRRAELLARLFVLLAR